MKRFLLFVMIFALAFTACTPTPKVQDTATVLKVSDGTASKTYTTDDLKVLGEAQATIQGVTYVGVPLIALLEDAGINSAALIAVKAVAIDGFTANYDPALFNREDTIVAYARVDGALAEDETPFRMVLPYEGGKMNPRQLTEIVAIQ